MIRFPQRNEQVPLPAALEFGGRRFDVVVDLAEYTSLSEEQVRALIRRELEDFRLEWHAMPEVLREDTWFYIASRSYLFGNAVHVHEAPTVVEVLAPLSGAGTCALDFGGGSGNLALALAALGTQVDFLELSALQKDFVRYRVAKHGLGERLRIVDRWSPLEESTYDLICAFDVFEHLPDLEHVLDSRIVPALKPEGALAERSPFSRNLANPMHHDDTVGFDSLLERRGFRVVTDDPLCRVWRR